MDRLVPILTMTKLSIFKSVTKSQKMEKTARNWTTDQVVEMADDVLRLVHVVLYVILGHFFRWYRRSLVLLPFGRASVPQRLLNQSLYQEILILQKFNDIGGKVLKPKKNSASNLKKIKWGRFLFFNFLKLGFWLCNFSIEKKSFHSHLKNVN